MKQALVIFFLICFFISSTKAGQTSASQTSQTSIEHTYKSILAPDICYLIINRDLLNTQDEQTLEKIFKHFVKGNYKIFHSGDRQTLLMISDEIKTRYKTQTTVLCLKSELSEKERSAFIAEVLKRKHDYVVWITKTENILAHIYAILENLDEIVKITENSKIKLNKKLIKQDIDKVVEEIKTIYNVDLDIKIPKTLNTKPSIQALIEWLKELKDMYKDIHRLTDIINELKNILYS